MKFKKEDLLDTIDDYSDLLELVESEFIDKGRWYDLYSLVFQTKDEKLFMTTYRVGSTEQQDESPFENEGDEIECWEVEPHETIKIIYVKKNG